MTPIAETETPDGSTDEILCPRCKSPSWTCCDEQYEDFEETATGEIFEWPVGYMKCNACGQAYLHYDSVPGFKRLGRWEDDRGYR